VRAMYSYAKKLSGAFGFPKSKLFPKILRQIFTEKEMKILLSLPGTPSQVAKTLRIDEVEVASSLYRLFMRGAVLIPELIDEKPLYTRPEAGMFIDLMMFDKQYDAYGEEFKNLLDSFHDQEYIFTFDAAEKPIFRVIPIEKEIKGVFYEILPYECVSAVIENARRVVVQRCPCRTRSRRCNNPTEICFSFDDLADYVIERGLGREVTKEEAMKLMNHAEDIGLVHQTTNSTKVNVICNCCTCCCSLLRSLVHFGKKMATVQSRYRSVVDPTLCNGCGTCLKRCHFGAITFENDKAFIWADRCFGCGLCTIKCPEKAISLVRIREREHIPPSNEGYPIGKIPVKP